ncbi:MAG TPA: rhomboid family intramembrane serine protease [Flavobacteriaceae bacterium]|nr:rhomboid family intramembrane serine protease [Flavobacteriaceae bacterium]
MGELNPVTLGIIAITVLISMKGFSDPIFFDKYKFNIGRIRQGEQIRMISSGFLHLDFSHLLFNMLTLYFFADVVIFQIGIVKFLILYVVSLIAGNLLSFYFHRDEYYYSAIGASGAVMGVLYAAILFYPDMSLYLFFIPIPIPAWIFGMAYLLYSIYGMKKRIGNIGHDAHIGGAVGGYLLTLLFAPYLFQTSLWIVILLAVPLVVLVVLHHYGKI